MELQSPWLALIRGALPGLLLLSVAASRGALWTAVNDQGATTNTHPNATRYHMLGLEDGTSGALRDLGSGNPVSAILTMTRSGFLAVDGTGMAPAPGTPLDVAFNGLVDFNTDTDNVGINILGTATFSFSNLDPACSYQVQAGAVRGNDLYTNRWTLVELVGAPSYLHDHSPGVLTSNEVPALAANQIAINFGANHTPDTGDLMNWLVLDPGVDGEFQLVFRKYSGEVPGGSSAGSGAYLPSALRVAGFIVEPFIQIVQQPQSQSVPLGETAMFSVLASGFPVFYQWHKDGVAIPGATQPAYQFAMTEAADHGAAFTVTAYNDTVSVTSAPAYLTLLFPPESVVPYDQVWRYEASGANLGTAWRASGFDDTTWPSGPGPLGFPSGEATPLPLATTFPSHNGITYYFRTAFVFDGEPADVDLVFTNFVDDGAVFYLNDTEMLRVYMPPAPSAVDYLTPASTGGEYVLRGDVVPGSALIQGTNHLAVEVHQVTGGSSDMVMGLHLLSRSAAPTPLIITHQPQSLAVEEGREARFTVGVSGRGARYQWFKNGLLIPGETGASLILAEAKPFDAAEYFVVASNAVSFVASDTATLTVSADTMGPTLVEAIEDVDSAGQDIVLTFSEGILENTATNLANYTLQSTLGSQSAILSIERLDAVTVRLTTELRAADENYFLTVTGVIDRALAANVIAPDTRVAVDRTLSLIDIGSDWHFYDPVPGIDPSLMFRDWYHPNYPVADWGLAAGGFVYDLGAQTWPVPARTILTGGNPIAYFRRPFHFPGSPLGARYQLRYAVDDGAVFYLQNREFHRWNMPEGVIDEDTPALSEQGVITLQTVPFEPTATLLFGTNVLAAALHDASESDLDRFFDAELKATVASLVGGPVMILSHPPDTTVMEGATARFICRSMGAEVIRWFRDPDIRVAGESEELVIEGVSLDMNGARFWAVVSNDTHSAISQVATLTVLPDVVSAGTLDISQDDNGIILSWEGEGSILEETMVLEGSNTVWAVVPDAVSPRRIPFGGGPRFYRLRQ